MESPIEVVRRFCAAWSDNMGAVELAAFFAEDAVYHNIPQEPVTGRENIANTIASVLRPGPPGIEGIDFRVINIAANGPVVMTERVDVFKLAVDCRIAFVSGGKTKPAAGYDAVVGPGPGVFAGVEKARRRM